MCDSKPSGRQHTPTSGTLTLQWTPSPPPYTGHQGSHSLCTLVPALNIYSVHYTGLHMFLTREFHSIKSIFSTESKLHTVHHLPHATCSPTGRGSSPPPPSTSQHISSFPHTTQLQDITNTVALLSCGSRFPSGENYVRTAFESGFFTYNLERKKIVE